MDVDGVSHLDQVVRSRQAGRPASDDRDPFPRCGLQFGREGIFLRQVGVRGVSLEHADRNRAIVPLPVAPSLAGRRTDPAQRGRKRNVSLHRRDRFIHLLRLDQANHRRDIHVRRARPLAGGLTVAHVFAQKQIQRVLPGVPHLFVLGLDDHALGGRHGAGRDESIATDIVDHADHARRGGLEPLQMAQGRDLDAQLLRGLQKGASLRNGHVPIVDRQPDFAHATSIDSLGQICLHMSHRVHVS